MKKFFCILFFFAFHSYICSAQKQTVSDSNRLEKLKKDYLTHKLELSPSESKSFWPLYGAYNNEIRKVWRDCNNDTPLYREKAAVIRDKYRPAFSKILSSHQRANDVYRYERQYRDMLKKTLEERGKK